MDLLAPVARALNDQHVRYVVIGVAGANYWAHTAGVLFTTQDRDIFLPPDAENLLAAWSACEAADCNLWLLDEPLDRPRDRWLADRIIERRMLTRAMTAAKLQIDLTLVMKGFDFDRVWLERRGFVVDGVEIPVARLRHSSSRSTRPGVTRTSCSSPRTATRSSSC